MNINEIKSDILNEKYYKINHPSGLTVYVLPRKTIRRLTPFSAQNTALSTLALSVPTAINGQRCRRVSLIFSSTNF